MKKYGLALTLLGMLVMLPIQARACDGGELILTDGLTGNIVVCLSVSGSNGETLTVESITREGNPSNGTIDSIAWEDQGKLPGVDPTFVSESGGTGAWSQFKDNGAGDGWHNDYEQSSAPVTNNGFISWTFSDSPGSDITVHVRFGDCSGWASTEWSPTNTHTNNCGTTQVPEPATLTLLGTGLVGIAGAVRRRMAKKS